MAAAERTVLLVDLPIALLVGVASWFSAQAARWLAAEPRSWPRGGPSGGHPWSGGPPEIWWWPLPFVAILIGGLAVRRVWPTAGFAFVVVGVAGFLAIGGPYGPVLLAPALALWSLTARLPVERWPLPIAVCGLMLTAAWWREPVLGLLDPQAYVAVLFGLAAILVPSLIALLLGSRREAELRARDDELRRVAYEERLRVAREVHDVVGHSLAVINLQAGVALHVLQRRPDQVEGALTAIRTTSKESLDELRSTLDVFRDPDLRRAPVAGLARLPDLVAALRAAGRDVVVEDERTTELPAAVDQAAYRIIQESLTNVVRHTTAARATVTLRTGAGWLVVSVCDDGPPTAVAEGNGITGMRERAAAVGGTLSVGTAGGVAVRAELPIGGSP